MSEKANKWMAEVMASPEYQASIVTHDLILEFEKRRDELGLSYADVARLMGVSRQRVNRLFIGTQNSTIGSLVKLALVLDCKLEISISPQPKKRIAKQAKRTTQKAARSVKPKRKPQKPAPKEVRV